MKLKKWFQIIIRAGLFLFIFGIIDLSMIEAAGFQSKTPILVLDDKQDKYLLGTYLEYLEDPSHLLDFEQASSSEYSESFIQGETDILNFGMTDSIYWLRFTVKNESVEKDHWFLELKRPSMNSVFLYTPSSNRPGYTETKTGYIFPFSTRDVPHENFVFNLNVPHGDKQTYYLRVKDISLDLPLRIWTDDGFQLQDQSSSLITALCFGALSVMLAYNIILLVGLRDRGFVYYVLFQLFLLLSLGSTQAYTSHYFWPNATNINVFIIPLFVELTVFFLLLYSREFLNFTSYPKWLEYTFYILGILLVLAIPPTFWIGAKVFLFVFPLASGVFTYVFILGVWAILKKHEPARYYLFAWSIFLIFGFITVFQRLGWLTIVQFTPEQALQLGAVYLVTFHSLAQVDRINYFKQQHLDSQSELIFEQQETLSIKEELNITLKNAQVKLENRVTQRTQELTELNIQLSKEIKEREQAQNELQRLAYTDPLTGLFNRRHFFDVAEHEFSRSNRYKHSLSFIILDIDLFKGINDTYGHPAGDQVLVHLGKLLDNITRGTDTVARFGGEEFIILLPETDSKVAHIFGERLRQLIEDSPIHFDNETISITVSIGVAVRNYTEKEESSFDQMISQADQALYEAKNAGRNQVVCFGDTNS